MGTLSNFVLFLSYIIMLSFNFNILNWLIKTLKIMKNYENENIIYKIEKKNELNNDSIVMLE